MQMKSKLRCLLAVVLAAVLCAAPAQASLTASQAHKVWNRVAAATGLTNLPFEVKEEKAPNAWVKNGSSVTVTTGLLKMLDSEDELFCVFGHEAGHAKLGHYERTVGHATGLSVAAAVLGQVFGNTVGTAANVGANLAYSGWSRQQEVEADDYAVKLAHEQHVNPVGMYRAIKAFVDSGLKTSPSGFNSHPPDERRLPHIKNEILKYEPNAVFPDETKAQREARIEASAKSEDSTPAKVIPKTGNDQYDIDAELERMKKEEADKKKDN